VRVIVLPVPSSNYRLVKSKFDFFCEVSCSLSDLDTVDNLVVIPGVSSFGSIVDFIDDNCIRDVLVERLHLTGGVVGICAGFQVFFEGSRESPHLKGLGFLNGSVESGATEYTEARWPHVGRKKVPGIQRLGVDKDTYYFNHKYVCRPTNPNLSEYIYTDSGICAGYLDSARGVYGFQFHPERSGVDGFDLIRSLCNNPSR
jgi:imidazole glycerol-phosphate synthase subunit HisH